MWCKEKSDNKRQALYRESVPQALRLTSVFLQASASIYAKFYIFIFISRPLVGSLPPFSQILRCFK